jgi:hypothetical protein
MEQRVPGLFSFAHRNDLREWFGRARLRLSRSLALAQPELRPPEPHSVQKLWLLALRENASGDQVYDAAKGCGSALNNLFFLDNSIEKCYIVLCKEHKLYKVFRPIFGTNNRAEHARRDKTREGVVFCIGGK